MAVSGPDGRMILDVDAKARLNRFGLTTVLREPRAGVLRTAAAQFKERFPEGTYTFTGTTTEGKKMLGSARLSHDTPNGPRISSRRRGRGA